MNMKVALRWAKRVFLSFLLILSIILVPIGVNKGYQIFRGSFLSETEKYAEDLERLEYIIKNEFSGYGVLPGTAAFDSSIAQLKESNNQNNVHSQTAFNLSVIKAVAAFRDPHTSVYNDHAFLNSRFPYYLNWSEGKFYLLSGTVDKKWLGAEVTKIGNSSSEEVFKKLSAYCNAPNEAGWAFFMSSFLYSPDVLFEEGIIEDRDYVDLDVQLNEEVGTLRFERISRVKFAELTDYHRITEKFEKDKLPLFRSNSGQNYWYKHLQEHNIFYLRYSMCMAQGDIEAFWDEVFEELEELDPDKLVIDVRGNPGGDTQNHLSLVTRLSKHQRLNQYGKLFTLIDRGTGSAAVSLASDMEKMTQSILVGEKTMDKPNTTSDPTFYTLPHSKITVLVPSLYSLHSYANDNREAVIPDVPITQNLKGEDYLIDDVMDSIMKMDKNESVLTYAELPLNAVGNFSFSPIRNASLYQEDSIWYFSIDGLVEAPIYQQDSIIFTRRYRILFSDLDKISNQVTIKLHGNTLQLNRIENKKVSLEKSIEDRNFDLTKKLLTTMQEKGDLPYYLDRPYFQSRVYHMYTHHGFDAAKSLNEIVKQLFSDDPVVSIVDFELYQYEGKTLRQIMAVFPVVGKLLKRYYTVLTTDKVMNDDYNAFIGK